MLETKENSKVREYLIRMISRFMDNEKIYTEQSIEAIIVESVRRLKESMNLDIEFVFAVNDKIGNVLLTAKDVGAEPEIIQRSAFNKEFGIEEKTIVSGDSPLLFDDREPLQHKHRIDFVNELDEMLNKYEKINTSGYHAHKNKKALDVLRYTGESVTIDCIILDKALSILNEGLNRLNLIQVSNNSSMSTIVHIGQSQYIDYLQEITNVKKDIENTMPFIEDLKKYYAGQEKQYQDYIRKQFVDLVDKTFLSQLTNILSSANKFESVIKKSAKDCYGSTQVSVSTVKEDENSKHIFASSVCSYEIHMPKPETPYDVQLSLLYDIDGKTYRSTGLSIPYNNGFVGSYIAKELNDEVVIEISLIQRKFIINVPKGEVLCDNKNNKIYACQTIPMNWEDAFAESIDSSDGIMASVDNEEAQEILKVFGDAWIRGKYMDTKWVWYYDSYGTENPSIDYTKWATDQPVNSEDRNIVYNYAGWKTEDVKELKKSIIEWDFGLPHDIDNLQFAIDVIDRK